MAPIALFTYNRPAHTRRTLETLAANPAAAQSRLTVFSDGPRPGDEGKVAEVRALVRERAWCGEVRLVESPVNRGLAANIIDGVTEILREADRVIVLEDDLALSPGFLAYMNDALDLYANESRVMSVAGWLPELSIQLPETFFLRTTTSWGWSTWRRAWDKFERDPKVLAEQVRPRVRDFNIRGGYDYFRQLQLNAEGRLKTWAILWYASIFIAGGLNLHPRRSLVHNVGHDHSGTHSRPDERFASLNLAEQIRVELVPIEAHAAASAAFRRRLRGPLRQRLAAQLSCAFKAIRRRLRVS